MILKNIIIIVVCLLIMACESPMSESKSLSKINSSTDSLILNDTTYPRDVIERGIQKEYDSAKFNFYLLTAIDTPKIEFNGEYAFAPAKPLSSYSVILDTIIDGAFAPIFIFSFIINGEKVSAKKAWDYKINLIEAVYYKLDSIEKVEQACIKQRGYSEICLDIEETCIYNFKITNQTIKNKQLSLDSIDTLFLQIGYRMVFLDNPKTIAFIKANHKDLNSWFVKMAKQSGMLQDD